mgnify:CR=1 FL=1
MWVDGLDLDLDLALDLKSFEVRGRVPWLNAFLDPNRTIRYSIGMKQDTKSSITLPVAEFRVVRRLKKQIGAKTNVEVIRQALRMLEESLDRQALRQAYKDASMEVRSLMIEEIEELVVVNGLTSV